jgi:hypothetical protein
MPQTLPVEKPVCSPGEPVQRQSGKEGNDETEIKNRSQNGKAASKEAKRTTPKPSRWWLSGKSLDQEVCSLCGLRFEPCGCSYDGH